MSNSSVPKEPHPIDLGRLVVHILSDWRRAKLRRIDARAWFVFAISNLVIAATGGLSLLPALIRVYWVAASAPATIPRARWVLVLGMRLRNGAITSDFALRLRKAEELQAAHHDCRVLVLGGGGETEGVTEAQKGKEYLVGRGVPASRVLLEDRSSNTLENLREAKKLLADMHAEHTVLVTNRYHLARSQAIAVGLGLADTLCAAEDRLRLHAHMLGRFPLEAYYLHWILAGRVWNRLVGRENA